jgi:transposase
MMGEVGMRRLIDRCAGIDVGQALLMVCVRIIAEAGEPAEHIREFGTTTPDLLGLRDWLAGLGVTHVAMESTGVYWKPVYYLLEDDFEVLLVNAAHLKHVEGRKTDTIDASWIAELCSYGLLRPSFVPPPPIRELRDLTRYRKALIQDRARQVNRIHKLLEDAGVKLACVATDIMGASGRAMMTALIDGVADPEALAQLAKGRLRAKLPELRKALVARFREHHAFLLERMLAHIADAEDDIAALSERIEAAMAPFAAAARLLCSIPGVGPRTAEVIIAEMRRESCSRWSTTGCVTGTSAVCPSPERRRRERARTQTGRAFAIRHDPQFAGVVAYVIEPVWSAAVAASCSRYVRGEGMTGARVRDLPSPR